MVGFLDEVHHDLVLAEAGKKHLQHSIQSLCSQEDHLRNEFYLNKKKVTRIINTFRQREFEIEQQISYCQLQRGKQNDELSRTEHKISCLSELEGLKGPLDFGRFPEEIRIMILEWALVEDAPIDFKIHSRIGHQLGRLAIFRTSKQIYAEAIAVFYRRNRFAIDGTDTELFLSPERVNYIRHLSLHLNNGISITKVFRAIEKCQDLRSLHICLVSLPRFQGRAKCNEERMRTLVFKRPTTLEQISTDIYSSSHLKMILEPLCRILQSILEGGGFEQALRKSARIGSSTTSESNLLTRESMAK